MIEQQGKQKRIEMLEL